MGGRFGVFAAVCVLAAVAVSCKKKAQDSAGNEPEHSSTTSTETAPPPAPATPAATPAAEPPAPAASVEVESKAILSREPVTQAAQVQHVLIGWKDLSQARDPRAMERTKEQADALALKILDQIKGGMNMGALMSEYSEDPGSAQTGAPYAVRPDSDFVAEFEALALRLNVGEAGICRTVFGYHIMKRVQ